MGRIPLDDAGRGTGDERRAISRHPPDDPPLLAYLAAMRGHRQAGPSSLGLPVVQVGDGSTFQAGNVDFAFIRTHLSLGFRSSAWIGEPFMPALDQAATAVPRSGAGLPAKRWVATSAIWKAT